MSSNVVDFKSSSAFSKLLMSNDPNDLRQAMNIIFQQELLAVANENIMPDVLMGLGYGEVREDYLAVKSITNLNDRQINNYTYVKTINNQKISVLSHVDGAKGMLNTAADFMAERNQQNINRGVDVWTRENRLKVLKEKYKALKAAGFSKADIRRYYSTLKIWAILTPHPTEDKNELGDQVFRNLIKTAEQVTPQDRELTIRALVRTMLSNRITPEIKLDRMGEIQIGLRHKAVWNKGMLEKLYDNQIAINTVYGEDTIEYTNPQQTPDVPATSWHNVDVDGKKVPAPVIFVQRLMDARRGMADMIGYLNNAHQNNADHGGLNDVITFMQKIKNKLDDICAPENLAKLNAMDSTDRYYKTQMQVFVDIFEKTPYKGDVSAKGPALPQTLIKDLNAIYMNAEKGSALHQGIFNALSHYNINGIATGRQQPRHDHNNYEKIFKNLFAYLQSNAETAHIINDELADGVTYDDISDDAKASLLNDILNKHKPKLKEWLMAANPGGYSDSSDNDKGWLGELLGHVELYEKCFNHDRMSVTVTANDQLLSTTMGQFIYQAFGIKNSIRMALNEDELTIKAANKKLKFYKKGLGSASLEMRKTFNLREYEEVYYALMESYSDAQKINGLFIRVQQDLAVTSIILESLDSGIATMIQKGGGMEANRGGVSIKATPRLLLSNMMRVKDKLGREFNEKERNILKQMVSFAASTYQGRHPGMALGTSAQVYDLIDGLEDEMIACHLAIDGKVPMNVVAPQYAQYSWPAKVTLGHIEGKARTRFLDMRKEDFKGDSTTSISNKHRGKRRIKHYIEQIGAPLIALFTNISNRSIVRGGAISGKFNEKAGNVHESRAIHWTKVARTTLENYDVSYTSGQFMRDVSHEYKNGILSKDDLNVLWNDPYITRFMYGQAMSVKPCADAEWGLDKIEHDFHGETQKRRWTVGRLMESHADNYQSAYQGDRERMKHNTAFHGTFVMDDLEFTALYEALGRTVNNDTSGPQLDAPIDKIIYDMYAPEDHLNALKFGKYTRENFPLIETAQTRGKDMRFINAAMHVMNERIKNEVVDINNMQTQSMLFNIGMAWRNWSVHNGHIVNDREGYGSRPNMKPVIDVVMEHIQAQENGVSNDNAIKIN